MRSTCLAALLLLCLSSPLFAEGSPPLDDAPALLGRYLRADALAKRLEARLQPAHFLATGRGGGRTLVRLEGKRLLAAGKLKGLRWTVSRDVLGGMRAERTFLSCELSPGGRVRSLSFRSQRGRERSSVAAVISGKTALITQRGQKPERVAWDPRALPFSVAAFLLPRFAAKLPPKLRLRIAHALVVRPNEAPALLTCTRTGQDARTLLEGAWGSLTLTARVAKGKLLELKLGDFERWAPLSAAQARALAPKAR